jgi:GT2 family glycosyltransferase/glycosyltransferase involved in cell wall biosynthesis
LFHRSHTKGQYKYVSEVKNHCDALLCYTIDDYMSKVPKESPHYGEMPENIDKDVRKVIKLCDRLIVTNDLLRMVYGQNIETYVMPNYLPYKVWELVYKNFKHSDSAARKFRLGWSGGMGHPGDLQILRDIAVILGDSVEWYFLGMIPEGFNYDNSHILVPVPCKEYPAALFNMDLDLALAPLMDNEFNRAKSNLRLLEYGACSFATLASEIRPYKEDKDCPIELLPYNAKVWAERIRWYMQNREVITEVKQRIYDWVWSKYKLEDHLLDYAKIFSPDREPFQPSIPKLEKTVDIVVTVYNHKPEVERCINSIFDSKNITSHEIVVIDDGSTDETTKSYLNNLRISNQIQLITLEKNQGYVTAVNEGMKLHPNRDVIILNSDTITNSNWIDRLRVAAYYNERFCTVTPFSNDATIMSYPLLQRNPIPDVVETDARFIEAAAPPREIPTPVGFCSYIKRLALADLGLFDVHAFGVGYGEENDWGMRAIRRLWKHASASNVFVGHSGSATFGMQRNELTRTATETLVSRWPLYIKMVEEWAKDEPLRFTRQHVDVAGLAKMATPDRVVFVGHRLGGGIETRMQQVISERYHDCIILRCNMNQGFAISMETPVGNFPNLPTLDIRTDINLMSKFFKDLKISKIIVESLVGYDYAAPYWINYLSQDSGIPYEVTLHDYFYICPRINLIKSDWDYCGEPDIEGCNHCIAVNNSIVGHVHVGQWREMYHNFLSKALRITAPSHDVIDRFHRYYPNLEIEYEPEHYKSEVNVCAEKYEEGKDLTIVLMGLISPQKGGNIMVECAKYALQQKLPLKFVVLGTLVLIDSTGISNITVSGAYKEADLPKMLYEAKAHLAFFPSLIPETYSITLSHAFKARLWPVAFSIGAQQERILEQRFGTIIPLEKKNDIPFIVKSLWNCRYGEYHQ